MNITALGPWITVSILGLIPVGDSATVAAKSSAKTDSGGAQAGRSHEAAKPKSSDPADLQPGLGTAAAPAQQNPTPSGQTQIVEERLRRGEMDEPGPQGRISDRLDEFYRPSEDRPGRPAAGAPDR